MSLRHNKKIKISEKQASIISGTLFIIVFAFIGAHILLRSHAQSPSAPSSGTAVCGQSILNSPYSYNGSATSTSTSGQYAGLPTFGASGTDFPNASSVVIIPAGNNSAAANAGTYQANNTIFYFEPGSHIVQNVMYTGVNSVYVGGYNNTNGEAVINGVNGGTASGDGGYYLSLSTNNVVNSDQTWEYLTIENYAASRNGAVLGNEQGGSFDDGNTYEYDTIGPNNYGYAGSSVPPNSGQNSNGGYGIGGGSNTSIEYDCMTQNAQGGFNIDGGGGGEDPTSGTGLPLNPITGVNISNNEISDNGLGIYPDAGSNPNSGGWSSGGKLFFTLNAAFTDNYVHDNYNNGVWFDTQNAGANISGNYISSNWGWGIYYEAGYNANISDNTVIGNGWASNGAWPSTPYCTTTNNQSTLTAQLTSGDSYTSVSVSGISTNLAAGTTIGINTGLSSPNDYTSQSYQYVTLSSPYTAGATTVLVNSFTANATYATSTSVQIGLDSNNCTNGYGPTAGHYGNEGAGGITTPDSGGNTNVSSNYSGQLLIDNNVLTNNWSAVDIYQDDARFLGVYPNQCGNPLLGQDATYYTQWNQEQDEDVTTTGSSTAVTTADSGFATFYQNGASGQTSYCSRPGPIMTPTAGMYVYDSAGHIPSGDRIASCSSSTSCTLTVAATGTTTGDTVYLSTPGGCGYYDLIGSSEGTQSGSPAAYYWDNCLDATRNISVSGNQFNMASNSVTACTAADLCGVLTIIDAGQGFPANQFNIYDGNNDYFLDNAPIATSPLNNIFSDNAYTWSGTGGSGAWQFEAGHQGTDGNISLSTWQNTDHQDSGSTFNAVSASNPTISLTSPSANTETYGPSYSVSSTASANDSGSISSVELLVNGTVIATDTAAPYNFSLNTLNYHNGTYTLEVLATDNEGNTSTANESVYISNGDFAFSGSVGLSDLAIMAANWGKTNQTYAEGNITGNTTINISDLSILAANWGWSE